MMGKLFYLKCAICKHEVKLHPTDGKGLCQGFFDGDNQPAGRGTIKAGWDYCNCQRTQLEINAAAKDKPWHQISRNGA